MAERIALEGLYERPTLFTENQFQISDVGFKYTDGSWTAVQNGNVVSVCDGTIVVIDGTDVSCRLPERDHLFICAGFYDENRCYYPGYFDANNVYQLGAIWVEGTVVKTMSGHYDAGGDWRSNSPSPEGQQRRSRETARGGRLKDAANLLDLAKRSEAGMAAEICVFWSETLLDQRTITHGKTFKVGNVPDADLVVEGIDLADLISNENGVISVNQEIAQSAKLVDQEGVLFSSEGWDGEVTAEFGVIFELGDFKIVARVTNEPAATGTGTIFDRQPIPYVSGSGIIHVLFLMLALTMPDNARALDLDSHFADNRFVQMSLIPDQEEEELLPEKGDVSDDQAAKHGGEEGEAGKPDEKPSDNRMSIAGDADELEIQKRDQRIANNAGIASQVMSMWAMNDHTNGLDARTFMGKIDGVNPGDSKGLNGIGIRGVGRGGGNITEGGIGLDDVGTKSMSHYKKGCKNCKADVGEKTEVAQVATPFPKAILGGTLDREIIRRVIRQNRKRIKFCYEKELQKNSKLEGEIVVKFSISASGDVTFATVLPGATLKNNRVNSCVTNAVRRLVFPAPDDGTVAIVKYPFRFFKG